MAVSYLKKYYFEDHKLAQRARLEFFRALATGRMIALTGSMSTRALGYDDWKDLRAQFDGIAKRCVDTISPSADGDRAAADLKTLAALGGSDDLSDVVAMSLMEDALEGVPELEEAAGWALDDARDLRERARAEFAKLFREPLPQWVAAMDRLAVPKGELERVFGVPGALWQNLGIRRFATTNYDFELERVLLLADRDHAETDGRGPFELLRALRADRRSNFAWDLGSGRIRRAFDDGWAVESDVLNRERIDRLIEFAIGTDDVDGHILHLHGRACNWRSMILTQRDYDALYRREDLNRAPFEFARRMMMGGNPILFVGLGMSEQDLNREMQEFISNSPYRRAAPTFLLWSGASLTEADIAAKRLKFLRTLGVLTIFDTDFSFEAWQRTSPACTFDLPKLPNKKEPDVRRLALLCQSVHLLAEAQRGEIQTPCTPGAAGASAFDNPTLREEWIGTHWRSTAPKVRNARSCSEPTILWDLVNREARSGAWPTTDHDFRGVFDPLIRQVHDRRICCVIGPQGCGKGELSRVLLSGLGEALNIPPVNRMLINGGFSFDTDTLLDGVAHFLGATFGAAVNDPGQGSPPGSSRLRHFERLGLTGTRNPTETGALVVINGAERFFDIEGRPLSAELDEFINLFRADAKMDKAPGASPPGPSRLTLVILGTERIRSHLSRVIGTDPIDFASLSANQPHAARAVPSWYLATVVDAAAAKGVHLGAKARRAIRTHQALASGKISGDTVELRKAVFGALFDDISLGRILGARDLVAPARTILRQLAFVGLPTDRAILKLLVPADLLPSFDETLLALIGANLVLEVKGFMSGCDAEPAPEPRLALHRTLLTELRFRYGIPLGEAKLSTAFNMGLYIAQPIDGDIPDNDVHDDLGEAIDGLIRSYRTRTSEPGPPDHGPIRPALRSAMDRSGASELALGAPADTALSATHRLCGRVHAEALRTALALVRSYYSTTGLLTLDSGDRILRDGRDGVLFEHAERLDDIIDAYGKRALAREQMRASLDTATFRENYDEAEPFYAEDLVWLHNERGVVELAMGDLYEARRSFVQAQRINREWVERDHRAHNWRRITLNGIAVDIEAGRLTRAEQRCAEIRSIVPPILLREDELVLATVTGYEAWCHQLRGRHDIALRSYERCCALLSDQGEVRAQAFFERLRADAMAAARLPMDDRLTVLERALDLAQSARQMDIVHRVRLSLADAILFGSQPQDHDQRRAAYRYMEEALAYSLSTEVHRVRCEASMLTARARHEMSDFEGALRFATDALMIATRYGMDLRKITLRAVIAKIMAARGHPVTAEHLARTCIKMATRRNFQTAIDKASRVLTDLPRMSAAISSSDLSGRRNY